MSGEEVGGAGDRAVSMAMGLVLLAIYLFGYTGMLHSIDEQAALAVTESLLAEGSWRTNQMVWEQIWEPSQNAFGLDGNLYSKKGLAVSLLALPLLALGKAWDAVGAVQLTLLLGPLLTAATGAVLYRLVRRMGFSVAVSASGALVWGLGTLAWPYARTLFSEPTAALGLTVALFGAVSYRRCARDRRHYLFAGGVGLALLILARQANAVAALPFGFYWLYTARRRGLWRRPSTLVQEGLLLAGPAVVVFLGLSWRSWIQYGRLYGHPLDPVEGFTTPLAVGLSGLLFSPGKGLVWYVPLAWLAVPAVWRWGEKARRPDYVLAAGVFLLNLVLYSLWWDWPGGTAWGPRLLATTTPCLLVLAMPMLEQLVESRSLRRRLLVGGVVLLSVVMQLPGALINTALQEGYEVYLGIGREQRLWQPAHSPILSHWHTLAVLWLPEWIWFQGFFWRKPLPLVAFTLLTGVGGAALAVAGWRRAVQRRAHRLWLAGSCLVLVGFMLGLVLSVHDDPRWHEKLSEPEDNQQLWRLVEQEAAAGDLVVLDMLLYYDIVGRTVNWMNRGPLPPRYAGWIREPALQRPEPLADWLSRYERIWLSLQMTPVGAAESTTERWLDRRAYRGDQHWFGTQRLVEYYVPAGDVITAGEGPIRFGDELVLASYRVDAGRRSDARLVELRWLPDIDPALRISVQVLDGEGRLLAQTDRTPGELSGEGGEYVVNRVGLRMPAGGERLILKVYHAETGESLPFYGGGEMVLGDYLLLYTEER